MPAGYEYHLDHRVVDAACWDVVTLAEWGEYLAAAARLPCDLRGAVEYLDLSEALAIRVNGVGALQIACCYEGLLDRGIRGTVIHAPDPGIQQAAEEVIRTCSRLAGGLPDGYRFCGFPIGLGEVHGFLDHGLAGGALVA